MKYILLAYRDEKWWETLSARERATFEQACQESEQDLVRRGHLIEARGLQNQTALTLRIEDGRISLSNGPVCSIQEQLAWLLTLEVRDLNAAVQLAATMPQARVGPIEVRPADVDLIRSP